MQLCKAHMKNYSLHCKIPQATELNILYEMQCIINNLSLALHLGTFIVNKISHYMLIHS